MSLTGPSAPPVESPAPPTPFVSEQAGPARPSSDHGPLMPLVGFDIETDTSTGGLDPEKDSIVAIATSTRWVNHPVEDPAGEDLVGQPSHDPPAPAFDEQVLTGTEEEILRRVDRLLRAVPAGYLVTWNGASFDLPYVARRAQIRGIELGLRVQDDPARRSRRDPGRKGVRASWYELVHLDGYLLYRADVGMNLGISCGLKPLARLVGMDPVELDLDQLHLASDAAVAAYVASDARTAVDLVMRRWPQAAAAADCSLPPVGP